MRNVPVVTEQQLQRMFACGKCNLGGRAAISKVYVVFVGRNWQARIWQVGVDKKVVMTGIWLAVARLDYVHTLDTELDAGRTADRITSGRCYEKYSSAIRRSGTCQCCWGGRRYLVLATGRDQECKYGAGEKSNTHSCPRLVLLNRDHGK